MFEKIAIQAANRSDVTNVYDFMCELEDTVLNKEVFTHIFLHNLEQANIYYYTAKNKSATVGFISFHTQLLLHHCGLVGEIQEFFIHKDFRGKGVGALLMNQIDQLALSLDIKSIEVTTNKKRTENIEIYQRLGFKLSHNKFTKE